MIPDHDPHPIVALFNLAIAVVFTIISWITLKDAQVILSMGASVVAMISGFFATRHFILQNKKKKQ